MNFEPSYSLFLVARYPRSASECYSLGVKDDETVFYTAGGKWSRDPSKCVCFMNEEAAERFLSHMRWTQREAAFVINVQGSFA